MKREIPEDVIEFINKHIEEISSEQGESDITAREMAELYNISITTARLRLEKLVEIGVMKRLKGKTLRGGWGDFYRRI